MIDEQRTLEIYGYMSNILSKGSGKKIVRICNNCGRVNSIRFCDYNNAKYPNLCQSCGIKGKNNGFYGKNHTDKTKQKLSSFHKGKHHSNETRQKMKNAAKDKTLTKEHKQKISKGNKGKPTSEESRIKLSCTHQGIERKDWNGFLTEQSYCFKFNKSCKERNRNKYNRECFICGKSEEINISSKGKHYKLSVHHVDMNKDQGCDDHEWELIPVCMNCHRMLHNDLWKNRIKYILNNN